MEVLSDAAAFDWSVLPFRFEQFLAHSRIAERGGSGIELPATASFLAPETARGQHRPCRCAPSWSRDICRVRPASTSLAKPCRRPIPNCYDHGIRLVLRHRRSHLG